MKTRGSVRVSSASLYQACFLPTTPETSIPLDEQSREVTAACACRRIVRRVQGHLARCAGAQDSLSLSYMWPSVALTGGQPDMLVPILDLDDNSTHLDRDAQNITIN